ncbi:hypothetical protein GCM10009872_26080 [Actinopolymorpha rutila]
MVLAASERVGASSVAELLDEAYCPLPTAADGTRQLRNRDQGNTYAQATAASPVGEDLGAQLRDPAGVSGDPPVPAGRPSRP